MTKVNVAGPNSIVARGKISPDNQVYRTISKTKGGVANTSVYKVMGTKSKNLSPKTIAENLSEEQIKAIADDRTQAAMLIAYKRSLELDEPKTEVIVESPKIEEPVSNAVATNQKEEHQTQEVSVVEKVVPESHSPMIMVQEAIKNIVELAKAANPSANTPIIIGPFFITNNQQ